MGATHAFAVAVVKGLELDDVGMPDDSHDLQLSVLAKGQPGSGRAKSGAAHALEALVLQDALDGGVFLRSARSLVWKTTPKEPLPTIFALGVGEISGLSGDAILHLFPDDLWSRVSRGGGGGKGGRYRPSVGY